MVMIGEEESFSLTANVTSRGYQRVVPTGYIVSRRSDGVYVAPLLPQLFYGADGTQLTTWRQNLQSTGSQIILSKPAGNLLIPREELYWRKISEPEVAAEPVVPREELSTFPVAAVALVSTIAVVTVFLFLWTRK